MIQHVIEYKFKNIIMKYIYIFILSKHSIEYQERESKLAIL